MEIKLNTMDLLSQRLQDKLAQESFFSKDEYQEITPHSRNESVLRDQLNKEEFNSENLIKDRIAHNTSVPEKGNHHSKKDLHEEVASNQHGISNIPDSTNKTGIPSEEGISQFIRARSSQWEDIKESLYNKFLSQINFEEIKGISDYQLNNRLRASIEYFVKQNLPLEFEQYSSNMENELIDELIGLGPLESLCRNKSITEIMVNGPFNIFAEKNGIIEPVDQTFKNEQHLRRIIDRIVRRVGRRIDESSPIVNARLADGSRVNAVIPPITIDGSSLTIRRFPERALTAHDLIETGSLTKEMAIFICSAINGSLNIIVSGGTGSGKTTFLNIASSFISEKERIVTIEDSAELQLQQRHVVRMETRIANVEGKGEIPIRELVKNALRMRPDRLVIGECRSGEAFDMLQAMNTGHDGSLTTLHANSPSDAVSRFAAMVLMSGVDIPEKVIRNQIASAIDLIVQVERLPDGSRKVTHISELAGVNAESVKINDIFRFNGKLDKSSGKVVGSHQAINFPEHSYMKLIAHGEDLSALISKGIFQKSSQ